MSNADTWVFAIAFGIVVSFLVSIHARLKRIEEKLEKLGK
jgi:hypothetical protein